MTSAPPVLVIMGVSGSGKTTVARELAEQLGWKFQEGDDLHPAANVAKMHSGIPLDDADRMPWLHAIAAWIDTRLAAGEPGIVTCSALKHSYRAILTGGHANVRIVYLKGDKLLIAHRLEERQGHFMPTTLLDSQFATLEEPEPEEHALVVEIAATPEQTTASIIAALGMLKPAA